MLYALTPPFIVQVHLILRCIAVVALNDEDHLCSKPKTAWLNISADIFLELLSKFKD